LARLRVRVRREPAEVGRICERSFAEIARKFEHDLEGVAHSGATAMAFVTNQTLTLAGRTDHVQRAAVTEVEIYHLERIVLILDPPAMSATRSSETALQGRPSEEG
jgi:hypothetical protein